MCQIGNEVGARHVFFVDVCGAYTFGNQIAEVVRWLDGTGEDVQLHVHPEYLPPEFWETHGFKYRPRFLNQYDQLKAEFTLNFFGKFISDITEKPIKAFRAGSFRWNANTIRALRSTGIQLSFNNSSKAFFDGVCPYREPTNFPFVWSNGIIEVPVSERRYLPLFDRFGWERMSFPYSNKHFFPPWRILCPFTLGIDNSFLVILMHSWSFLYWDKNGQAEYRDDRRIESYRRLVQKLSKDYDIITTHDFLDLYSSGKIKVTHSVDIALTELRVPDSRGKVI